MHGARKWWQSFAARTQSRAASALELDPAYVAAESLRLNTSLVEGDTRPLSATLSRYFGRETRVVFDDTGRLGRMSSRLRYEHDRLEFAFAPQPEMDEPAKCVFIRFMSSVSLFAALARSRPPLPIEAAFNMNDEGVDDGFAFCDYRENFTLIPDNFFLDSRGYAAARSYFQTRAIAWDDRRDVVLWRGISSGQRTGSILELPRVALCQLCRSDMSGIFDVGLTAIVAHNAEERGLLESLGLLMPHMPWSEFGSYRFHIDIDGHTNSWPGLMLKLLTGGLVFKVNPPYGHRQWYYDRLRPFENYVPVRSDLSDLFELVNYFRSRQDLARQIGHQGQQLAWAMTFESELDYGVRAIVGREVRQSSRAWTKR